jgi:hypothetical protein
LHIDNPASAQHNAVRIWGVFTRRSEPRFPYRLSIKAFSSSVGKKFSRIRKEKSPMKLRTACVVAGFFSFVLSVAAQTSSSSPALAQAPPPLIQFSNVATDEGGNTLSGVVNITFSLFNTQQGGEPLWSETQNNVPLDPTGHYSVQLGVTRPNGVPTALFTTGEARWLGVQIAQQPEQPRVLLLSVPYALKAGDAQTIGGLPPSAFVLAAPSAGSTTPADAADATSASGSAPPSSAITGTGTVNHVPLWDTTSDIVSSVLYQSGTGTTAKIGVNTTTPLTTLDVKGAATIRGTMGLPATGTATATSGANSQPLVFQASAFSSTTSKAVNQTFQWQAESAGNDTATPSGTLNLLFGSGTTAPAETGLKLSNKGLFTFATGQTFPGTGTITGITTASGSGLAGGGTTGTLSLSVPAAGITNAMLANSKITLNANTAGGITTPGGMTLGDTYTIGLKTCSANQVLEYVGTAWTCSSAGTGTVTSVATGAGLTGGPITGSGTLSINTAVVPELGTANTFTNQNTINNLVTINAANSTSPALAVTNTAGNGINISVPVGGYGIQISAPGGDGDGVIVENAGVFGVTAAGGYQGGLFYGASGGTYSENDTDSNGAVAAYAFEFGATYQDIGFWGHSASTAGIGVYGQAVQASATGQEFSENQPAGVWGDSGAPVSETRAVGVFGTADDGVSVLGYNNSPSGYAAAEFGNYEDTNDTWPVLFVFGGYYEQACSFDVSGNLTCTGKIGEAAPVDGGSRKVALNSVQSPEAWFEDAGSGQLSGGQAVVNIESVFGQTINTGVEYHVFLTPNGDCKGLYVAEKSATSFVVRELGGGTSSIAFDYRIMAKRKNFENVRLADVTKAMTIKRPVKSAANARHLPSAQSIREQEQEHAKRRTVAGLSGPASNKKR